MSQKTEFSNRLRQAMKDAGYVASSTVLTEWLGCKHVVLRFGEAVRQAVRAQRARWGESLNHVEHETIDAYLRLPAAQRKVVRRGGSCAGAQACTAGRCGWYGTGVR